MGTGVSLVMAKGTSLNPFLSPPPDMTLEGQTLSVTAHKTGGALSRVRSKEASKFLPT